jgi:hypothetical protein
MMFWMLWFSKKAFQASIVAIDIWWHILLPSFFPTLIFGNLLSRTKVIEKWFADVRLQLFLINVCYGPVVYASRLKNIICSQPSNADSYANLIAITYVYSPIIVILLLRFFEFPLTNLELVFILVSYYLSALIILIIQKEKPISFRSEKGLQHAAPEDRNQPIGQFLAQTIIDSGTFVLRLGAIFIFLSVVVMMLNDWSQAIPITQVSYNFLFDLTQGLLEWKRQRYDDQQTTSISIFIVAMLCWGGLSNHLSLRFSIIEIPFGFKTFVKVRLIQSILGMILVSFFNKFLA